jgi:2',3'-cyclic-nucleotide 2'-phosphodiesterase
VRVLFLGDVMGEAGRKAVLRHVPRLRSDLALDFVIVNGENSAAGFGITEKICETFFDVGVDVITTGNHAWDQREVLTYIEREPRLLRPCNYPPGTPGRGAGLYTTAGGKQVLVVQAMTRLFMDPLDDPFRAVDEALASHRLVETVDFVLLDIHGEATSEKQAMAWSFDGRISAAFGSHSHVPTADARILPNGTAYQTDAGMCGDYESIIGMKPPAAVSRFLTKIRTERMEPADGEATLCGVFVETSDATGLARSCMPVRVGGKLAPAFPELAKAAQ